MQVRHGPELGGKRPDPGGCRDDSYIRNQIRSVMSTDKDPKPMFQFLTSGVVKEDADDKFPKAHAHGFKGPGVVRGIKPVGLKKAKDDTDYGLGSGVVKGKE